MTSSTKLSELASAFAAASHLLMLRLLFLALAVPASAWTVGTPAAGRLCRAQPPRMDFFADMKRGMTKLIDGDYDEAEVKIWIWDDQIWNEFQARDEGATDRQLMVTAMQELHNEQDILKVIGRSETGKGRGGGSRGRGGGKGSARTSANKR